MFIFFVSQNIYELISLYAHKMQNEEDFCGKKPTII